MRPGRRSSIPFCFASTWSVWRAAAPPRLAWLWRWDWERALTTSSSPTSPPPTSRCCPALPCRVWPPPASVWTTTSSRPGMSSSKWGESPEPSRERLQLTWCVFYILPDNDQRVTLKCLHYLAQFRVKSVFIFVWNQNMYLEFCLHDSHWSN